MSSVLGRISQYPFALLQVTSPPSQNSNTELGPFHIYGYEKSFVPPNWETKDDRVRGGASQSYLSPLPHNAARFHGHLDTATLGGAGFASQFSPVEAPPVKEQNGGADGHYWDLSSYDGIDLRIHIPASNDAVTLSNPSQQANLKMYTFIIKDEKSRGQRELDGREKAGVNWETEFDVPAPSVLQEDGPTKEKTIRILWHELKATYRGKEIRDPGKLKTSEVRRVGLMMRSYFDKQDGDFSLDILSISAFRRSRQVPDSDH